ncbi:quinolinate synthase NadA [Paenibacillus larvae subsp. larvae]|uniref:quinolinate synthase NadA n=1 Tax=Paenibacillus larvae TaxID=1464 RepID=UPI0023A94342|nr:quinolinate synthase NadA [Paenibacillus larvae]MDE5127116.1 quinolinate synthase NadA [Paenibacillus larvae subsp. larvae]MDE5134435.1 quinolinate synthase NadA [Paenibacillus larvae subsp. larvae]MDE5138579.1 quinolinate synthase NadA [Paenibacillus larvae subsp. larvae]MDE5142908.1 quinolinate synthase NadA [Paenibacillus larvae subsp. larvae]MDE5150673.1 quinolinate synthase NadA [Paenibacillus larvae subsp. larvae]
MEALALQRKAEQTKELKERIKQLKKERNAIILAHYYQRDEIQDIADFRGDSFLLAQKAAETDADIIVFCGVHFMGESAKILALDKKVIIPDERAGCPMADMVNVEGLKELKRKHPHATVVAYINTSADVKAETDICCTSANAVKVIESVETGEIIWVPDKNLGNYVSKFTNKNMIIWEGYCNTHDMLTVKDVEDMKAKHPNAQFVVHPECRPEVVAMGDFVGSTTAIIKYCRESGCQEFIVGTEDGTGYQLRLDSPHKTFHFATKYLVCPNMKVNNLKKVARCLETMQPEVFVHAHIADQARLSLERMLQVK